jgi:hypothetical protein
MDRVTVDQAKSMMRSDIKAMRSEYSRMRDIAQKRIQRLSGSEFSGSKAYMEHKKGFKKLSEINIADFAKAYSELSKFISAKASSVSGQKAIRQKTIETWNRQGIPLSKENYNRTIRILEEMRKRKIVYGSDTAEEVARITLGLSEEQFGDVLDNLEEYLTHTEELADFMESHYDAETGYQLVDMDDFRQEIGW